MNDKAILATGVDTGGRIITVDGVEYVLGTLISDAEYSQPRAQRPAFDGYCSNEMWDRVMGNDNDR